MLGSIIKADLRTIRNIRDRAGDISREKDFINVSPEDFISIIGSPLNPESLLSFVRGRGGQISEEDAEFLVERFDIDKDGQIGKVDFGLMLETKTNQEGEYTVNRDFMSPIAGSPV
jgi:Ca2+-binding EF-hand superfamily protein